MADVTSFGDWLLSVPGVRRELKCYVNARVHGDVLVRSALASTHFGSVWEVNRGLEDLQTRGIIERGEFAPWMCVTPTMSFEATPASRSNPHTGLPIQFWYFVRGAWWLTPKHWHILRPTLVPLPTLTYLLRWRVTTQQREAR